MGYTAPLKTGRHLSDAESSIAHSSCNRFGLAIVNFLQVRSVIYYYAVSCAVGMKRFVKQFKSNGTYLSILRTISQQLITTLLLWRSGKEYICYFIETKSLSSKDLVKDSGVDIYIKKDILTTGDIDRSVLPAFTYLKEAEEPSDCSAITDGDNYIKWNRIYNPKRPLFI